MNRVKHIEFPLYCWATYVTDFIDIILLATLCPWGQLTL